MNRSPDEEYRVDLRTWHLAVMQRVEQQRAMFEPVDERDQMLIYPETVTLIEQSRAAEASAWDRFLRARDVFAGVARIRVSSGTGDPAGAVRSARPYNPTL